VALAAAAGFFWIWQLRRQVRRQTLEIEEKRAQLVGQ
jgi:hypothetical protein